ncbi:hypothetical protein PCH_Pc20g10450 [Penicillium rubens Wisconsin 54-1255]|uniref:Uncharacterized protein n=1 Tax=Penicillium rubens (strain ATCC 28089 / DSM 1075 / NRRL 1951 / Wisconsin 54-1255) TaxID=500485 RepID=B6HFU0_PENRW|nr:hypothetical protein PCH_Pc20g10450 [Penicillium rubens Wisconsin 54-1255]
MILTSDRRDIVFHTSPQLLASVVRGLSLVHTGYNVENSRRAADLTVMRVHYQQAILQAIGNANPLWIAIGFGGDWAVSRAVERNAVSDLSAIEPLRERREKKRRNKEKYRHGLALKGFCTLASSEIPGLELDPASILWEANVCLGKLKRERIVDGLYSRRLPEEGLGELAPEQPPRWQRGSGSFGMFHPERVAAESLWGRLSGIRAIHSNGPDPTCLRKSKINRIAVALKPERSKTSLQQHERAKVLGAGSTARLDVPHMQIIFVDLIIHYSMDPRMSIRTVDLGMISGEPKQAGKRTCPKKQKEGSGIPDTGVMGGRNIQPTIFQVMSCWHVSMNCGGYCASNSRLKGHIVTQCQLLFHKFYIPPKSSMRCRGDVIAGSDLERWIEEKYHKKVSGQWNNIISTTKPRTPLESLESTFAGREGVRHYHPRRRGQTFELPVAFPLPSASCVLPGCQPVKESVNKEYGQFAVSQSRRAISSGRWSNNDYGANYINRSIETKIRNTDIDGECRGVCQFSAAI